MEILTMPQPSPANLLSIATANQRLIQVVKELYYASEKSSDPTLVQHVHAYANATLDLTGSISAALTPPDSNLLMIASTNQQTIALTQDLYYRLTSSSDPQFASLAGSYVSKVLDLTGQISAAIPGI
jgi:hypothetical protein